MKSFQSSGPGLLSLNESVGSFRRSGRQHAGIHLRLKLRLRLRQMVFLGKFRHTKIE